MFSDDKLKAFVNEAEWANLYVCINYQGQGGVVGIAWLGTVCLSDSQRTYRMSMNAYYVSDLITGEVRKC